MSWVFLYMGHFKKNKTHTKIKPIQKFDSLILGELYLNFLLENYFSPEDGCN